jgi:hypothetical protein
MQTKEKSKNQSPESSTSPRHHSVDFYSKIFAGQSQSSEDDGESELEVVGVGVKKKKANKAGGGMSDASLEVDEIKEEIKEEVPSEIDDEGEEAPTVSDEEMDADGGGNEGDNTELIRQPEIGAEDDGGKDSEDEEEGADEEEEDEVDEELESRVSLFKRLGVT